MKAWLGEYDNDENDGQVANTPTIQPTTAKKLRTVGPTPHVTKSTVKTESARSTVKKEFGKSVKKEIEKFALVHIFLLQSLLHVLSCGVCSVAH